MKKPRVLLQAVFDERWINTNDIWLNIEGYFLDIDYKLIKNVTVQR